MHVLNSPHTFHVLADVSIIDVASLLGIAYLISLLNIILFASWILYWNWTFSTIILNLLLINNPIAPSLYSSISSHFWSCSQLLWRLISLFCMLCVHHYLLSCTFFHYVYSPTISINNRHGNPLLMLCA